MKIYKVSSIKEMEQFKDEYGYKVDGSYIIFNNGKIYSKYKKRFLKPTIRKNGYAYIRIYLNGEYNDYRVHTLIAKHFLKNPCKYKEINHKNCNKSDNNVKNLEWCSRSLNMKHAYENKLWQPFKNEESNLCKLSNKVVQKIRTMYRNKIPQLKLAKLFNTTQGNISCIVNYKTRSI